MEKIRFVKYENIPGHVVGSYEGCVFATDPIVCGYPGTGDTECDGGIYVEEQEPVQQTITEQGEPKRVKYVALTLFNKQGYFTESVAFDSQKEAEKWLVGNYQDRSAVSFEIVEMEY